MWRLLRAPGIDKGFNIQTRCRTLHASQLIPNNQNVGNSSSKGLANSATVGTAGAGDGLPKRPSLDGVT